MALLGCESGDGDEPSIDKKIAVTPSVIEKLRDDYVARTSDPPTLERYKRLVDTYIEQETLYRFGLSQDVHLKAQGARRRLAELAVEHRSGDAEPEDDQDLVEYAASEGLHHGDAVVRLEVAGAVRARFAREASAEPPTEAEVEACYENNKASYWTPERRTVEILQFADREEASEALGQLERATADPRDDTLNARKYERLPAQTRDRLEKLAGAVVAGVVFEGDVREWIGPMQAKGHVSLLRVEQVSPSKIAPLNMVRRRVVQECSAAKSARRLRERLSSLRETYDISIDTGGLYDPN